MEHHRKIEELGAHLLRLRVGIEAEIQQDPTTVIQLLCLEHWEGKRVTRPICWILVLKENDVYMNTRLGP